MAESRREKRFLRLSVFCTGSAANAAITGPLAWGNAGPLAWDIAGPLVWGALPAPWFRAMPAPWFQGNAGPWIRAFILTASKSRINDETPLNSSSLRGRSSLFRDIAVLG